LLVPPASFFPWISWSFARLLVRRRRAKLPFSVNFCLKEGLGHEFAYGLGRDQLQRLVLEHILPRRWQQFAHKVGREVVHKRHRSQDRPAHLPARRRLGYQMLLDIVLADKLRDVSRSVDGKSGIQEAIGKVNWAQSVCYF
jgi:hypothetical protein